MKFFDIAARSNVVQDSSLPVRHLYKQCHQSSGVGRYFWQLDAGVGHSYLAYMLPNFTFSDDLSRGLGGESNRLNVSELERFLRSESFRSFL